MHARLTLAVALLALLFAPLAAAATADVASAATVAAAQRALAAAADPATLLLNFKSSLDNGDLALPSWVGANPCSGWAGVRCKRGKIVRINLSQRGLKGVLQPWEWPSTVRVLYLDNNLLRGKLPATWPGLPPQLRELKLNRNMLLGKYPKTLVLPPNLQRLSLADNALSNVIFKKIQLPATLISVDLSRNRFTGRLPSWPALPNTVVYVQPGNTRLCGPVPDAPIYRDTANKHPLLPACGSPTPPPPPPPDSPDTVLLMALKATLSEGSQAKLPSWRADVSACAFKGVFCNEAGRVIEINLSDLSLVGQIPAQGWPLPNTVEKLYFSYNKFFGSIRGKFPASLKVLDLASNKFDFIEFDVQLPAALEWLLLGGNKLTQLDARLSLPNTITRLDLSAQFGSGLQGNLPNNLALPDALEFFSIENNALSGSIPWIGAAMPPNLQTLDLSNNQLRWKDPESWDLGTKLVSLDLSSNPLAGTFPLLQVPETIKWLFLANARLTGGIPAGYGGIFNDTAFAGMYLNNNDLSGPVPIWPNVTIGTLYILPGNFGLCAINGTLPTTPKYASANVLEKAILPKCT